MVSVGHNTYSFGLLVSTKKNNNNKLDFDCYTAKIDSAELIIC